MVQAARTAAPWYLRAGAWIGIGTGPGALVTGGLLAAGRGAVEVLTVFVLGAGLIAAVAVAQGLVGRRRRAATVQLAQETFGSSAGPRMVAALVTLGVVCWDGFYIALVAAALHGLTGVPAPLLAVVLGAVFWMIYRRGFRQWNLVVAVTGVAALAVGVLVLTGVPAGAATPPAGPFGPGAAAAGIGSVVAYAAVFAVRAADFTHDAPRERDVLLPGLALFASLTAFLLLGAAIQARSGSWDLADLVARSATPSAGALLLTLSIVAPSVSGLHSGALGLERLFNLPLPAGAGVVAAGAALLGATRFDLHLLPFLAVLGAALPPVAAVLLLRRETHRPWHGWVAWAAGSTSSLAALAAGLPAAVLLGLGIAAGLMLALGRETA